MLSSYAVKCSNCRCEYDTRSYQAQDGLGARCPSCGYLLSHQQMQSQLQQGYQQQNQFNTLSNMMNGMAGLGNSQLGAQAGLAMQQMAAAQFKPNVQSEPSTVPELAEYERRVKAIKVEIPQFIKETRMFGLWKQRTELRIEIKKLAEDLEHHRKNEEMRIAEAVQKERLKYNEEVAKVKLECDKKLSEASNKNELAITQLQGKATRDKAEMQAQFAKDLSEAKTKAAEDYYNKMTQALTELHQNGDKNSRFVQNLALELMKKSPKVAPGSVKVRAKGTIKELQKLDD